MACEILLLLPDSGTLTVKLYTTALTSLQWQLGSTSTSPLLKLFF